MTPLLPLIPVFGLPLPKFFRGVEQFCPVNFVLPVSNLERPLSKRGDIQMSGSPASLFLKNLRSPLSSMSPATYMSSFLSYIHHFLSFGNLVVPHKAESGEDRGENRGGVFGQDCTRNDHNGQEAKLEQHRFWSYPFYRTNKPRKCQYSEILRPYLRPKGSFDFVAGKSFCLK